jgi:hypothetical protein
MVQDWYQFDNSTVGYPTQDLIFLLRLSPDFSVELDLKGLSSAHHDGLFEVEVNQHHQRASSDSEGNLVAISVTIIG